MKKTLATLGIIMALIAAYLFSRLTLDVSPEFLMFSGFIQGIGLGLFFVPLSSIAFIGLSHSDYAEASGVFSFFRSLGMSLGISLLGTLLARESQINWQHLSSHVTYFNAVFNYNHIHLQNLLSLKQVMGQIARQASLISFIDAYYAVTIGFIFFTAVSALVEKKKS